MKIFLSYMLLFLYTLTCTGSSVYMHLCKNGSIAIVHSEQLSTEGSCLLCDKSDKHSENQTRKEHRCGDQSDCCKDVRIDLKKGNQEIENSSNAPSFLTLSPAITTLHWILLVPAETTAITSTPELQSSQQLASSSPPYLVHCNFRI